jgi:hypothetical protein
VQAGRECTSLFRSWLSSLLVSFECTFCLFSSIIMRNRKCCHKVSGRYDTVGWLKLFKLWRTFACNVWVSHLLS